MEATFEFVHFVLLSCYHGAQKICKDIALNTQQLTAAQLRKKYLRYTSIFGSLEALKSGTAMQAV